MTKENEQRAKIFQQAMMACHSNNPIDCVEWFADRIIELEKRIEKMKRCENCTQFDFEERKCKVGWCNNFEKWELREVVFVDLKEVEE